MGVDHVGDLRHEIASGRVTCIVGAGVSIAASLDPERKPNVASWVGLLEDGIDRCAATAQGLPPSWPRRMRDMLELGSEGDADALLSVAEQITGKLGGSSGGELRRWIRETVGALRLRHADVPLALGDLGVPLVTTNYDGLLEDATHLRALDWQDTADVERVLRGEDRAVIHLHGYWRRPENLILGIRSYEEIVRHPHAQAVLRALRMTKTLLFIGFGAGMDDPNFGALRRWTREVFAGSEVRHYRLALAGERDAVQAQHTPEERVFVLSYGDKHSDLAPFLRSLAPEKPSPRTTSVQEPVMVGGAEPPRPRILVAGPWFGVPKDLRPEILRVWKGERRAGSEKALARIRARLRRDEVRQAQIAAVLRYDVILDLSPWRAFASRWSLGLCDVEREAARDGSRTPFLYMTAVEGDARVLDDDWTEHLAGRLSALPETRPDLNARIDELLGAGLALGGFGAGSEIWGTRVLSTWPAAPILLEPDLAHQADVWRHKFGARFRYASEPLDAPLRDPSFDDYLRAIRITAGQVTLAGETAPRPLQDLYVELEVQREEDLRKRSGSARFGESSESESSEEEERGALREEVEARRNVAWDVPGSEVIQASAVHEVARRVLLWGPAGSGKSTLLRHMACKVTEEGRVPLWIPRLVDLGDDLPAALTRRALEAVGLPEGRSPAYTQLYEAIVQGRAFLLLDGFDEAPPAVRRVLPRRIDEMHPELRVVLASRPLHRTHTGLTEITVTGLPVTGAEDMLRAYFKEAAWIGPLLHDLGTLPDGTTWMRNPVLLGLAASLYQREPLPDAALDLYGKVIGHLLNQIGSAWPVDEVLPALQVQARRMLLPQAGDATVVVRVGDLPYAHRDAMLASGLFTGDDSLRFTHLTLGEYLAAGSFRLPPSHTWSARSLAEERALDKDRPEAKPEDESALEVLPMAHALAEDHRDLVQALEEGREEDSGGHRRLRLVLRTVGYGGPTVRAFCAARGEDLLGMLAARMQMPSGRFGDFERLLMGDAERAALVLRGHLGEGAGARVQEQLGPVLETRGEAAAEAHVLLWNLGLRKPEKRLSRWWSTIRRQARALVRAGMDVDEIRAFTFGYNGSWATVVEALERYKEHWERLRVVFEYDDDWAKESVVRALKRDAGSQHLLRECLEANNDRVRNAATWALGDDEGKLVRNIDRIRALLVDRVRKERATAIRLLKNDEASRRTIRALLREHLDSADDSVGTAAIEVCANDPLAQDTIAEYLRDSRSRYWDNTIHTLAAHDHWRPLIRERILRTHPDLSAVRALSKDPGSWPLIRGLLKHDDANVRFMAASSLEMDSGTTGEFLRLLADPDKSVRHACIGALGGRTTTRGQIYRFLDDSDPDTVKCTIESLADDEQSVGKIQAIFERLHRYSASAALRMLAHHASTTRDWLWNYYASIINKRYDKERHVDFVDQRATIVQSLANDPPSKTYILKALDDEDARVREAAVKALTISDIDPPTVRRLLNDPHSLVHDDAVKLAAQDPVYHGEILELLEVDQWALRTTALRLLIVHREARIKLLDCMKNGRAAERTSALQALAHVSAVRTSIYSHLDDPNDEVCATAIETTKHDPMAKRLLREKLVNGGFGPILFNRRFYRALDALAKDPEAQPIFEELSASNDNNLVAAVLGPLGNYPGARPRIRAILADKGRVSNEHVAAIEALAGDPDSRSAILAFLHDEEAGEDVRAAAVEALAEDDDAEVQAYIRGLLSIGEHKKIRRAAVKVIAGRLAKAPEGKIVLLEHLRGEDEDNIRVEIIAALEREPGVVPTLRERLRDPNSVARFLAVRGLRLAPERAAVPLARTPSLQLALHLAGHEPTSESLPISRALRDRVEAYVKSPRPQNLDRDPDFAEAILGYLCTRLAWASKDGAFGKGCVFGEIERPIGTLRELHEPLVIRVAMDSSELPRERFLHPAHNLIEAWQVATHLSAANPPAFFLACADVAFEHLQPPDLEPGKVYWGPGFYGFRLKKAKGGLDPLEWLVSSEARELWNEADPETQERYRETLIRLAEIPSLDPWAVIPILSRVGDLLPLGIRAAFAKQLPQGTTESVMQLEGAARNVGAPAATLQVAAPVEGPAKPAGALAQLHVQLDVVRTTLDRDEPIGCAIDAFEIAAEMLASDDNLADECDDAVMLLDGLRDRVRTAKEAKRLLAVAAKIPEARLLTGPRRRLGELRDRLRARVRLKK